MTGREGLRDVLDGGGFAVTAECGPPRGADRSVVVAKGNLLKPFVHAVNVTDNQTAQVRMSSLAACLILQEEGIEPVMQMTCRDRNRIALQSDLIGAGALGIRNVLCLSGDHQSLGDHKGAKNVFDIDSVHLIRAARRMVDDGVLMNGKELTVRPQFFVGAVENPFSLSPKIRAYRLAKKIAAGARFIQTQSVFDIDIFLSWMEEVRNLGLHEKTYILAGITPLKSVRMAKYLSRSVPGMKVPDGLIGRLDRVPPEEAGDEGVKIAVETIDRLRAVPGVAGIHIMAVQWEEKVGEIVVRAGLEKENHGGR